jgi:protein-disulfide isomerase
MASDKPSARVQAPKARPGGKPGDASGGPRTQLTSSRILALAVVAAIVIAGVLIGISVAGSSSKNTGSNSKNTGPSTLVGKIQTRNLLSGIPQQGNALGRPDAPVTLVEYADPACPYCMHFALDALPAIVRQYVRPGNVRLVYNGLAFVGPASEPALRAIDAAGVQNKAWYVIDLLYRNQGNEQTNWATTSILGAVAKTVPGLDPVKMMKDMSSSQTTAAIHASTQRASSAGVHQTPTFFVGRTGGTMQELSVQSLTPSAFTPTLDGLLAK